MKLKVLALWLSIAACCLVIALALGQHMKATASGPAAPKAAAAEAPEATVAAVPRAAEPAAASVAAGQAAADNQGAQPDVVAQAEPAAQSSTTTTTTTTTTTHGGWTVTCKTGADPAQKSCSAEFRVVAKDNKGVVLIWLLGRNAEGKLLAEFVTPSDILIKPGVAVSLNDAKAVTAEYVSCTAQRGCRASLELTPSLVRNMKAATKAKIGITLTNGKVLEIRADIPGAELALSDLGV